MIELVPLFDAVIDVGTSLDVGAGPAGNRFIGEISAARVEGERIRASLAGAAAADWMVRTGAIAVIDVRLTLRTDDGALIFMQYGGRLDLSSPPEARFAFTAPTFETGDERYAWLNAIQAAGKGRFVVGPDGARLEYEIYEIR
jgi:hypothetical protein